MSQDGRSNSSTNPSRGKLRFDENGNMTDSQGGVMVPHHIVQQYVSGRQKQQCSMYPSQFRGSLSVSIGPSQTQGAQRPQPLQHSQLSSTSTPAGHESRASRIELPAAKITNSQQAGAHDQPAIHSSHQSHRPSLAISRTNNLYSVAAPAHSETAEGPLANDWLPQDAPFNFDSSFPADNNISWYQVATSASGQPRLYDQSPLRSREPLTPSIRLTSPDVAGAQPQDATSNFSTSPMQPLPPYPYNNYPEHNSGHLSPQQQYSMTGQAETMQTPVSPVSEHSPHDASMAEQQLSRKRSHSEMSQSDTLANAIQQQSQTQAQPAQQVRSRSASVASQLGASPNGANEDFNPRGSRAFKRGDPPTNEQNKYICTFAEECAGQTFDRKCEWSKHMDKHDRPYRCQHQSCAKLQGFTYSGGLLRHEREVHGKHGGPKAALMCPVADCKRHSGKGFTRKENLNEHLRRVHPGTDAASQQSQTTLLKRDATDVTMGAEDGDTPASMGGISETVDQQQDHYTASPAIANKRKRSLPGEFQVDFTPDYEPELKRLRQLVQEQEERIRQDAERLKLQDANANHYENRVHELERQNADQADRISKMESELAEANIRSQLVSANASGAV